MKKIMTLAAVAVFASAASASTLTWGYGGGYLYLADFGDEKAVGAHDFTTGTLSADAKFVLVYLGTSSTFTEDTIKALNNDDSSVVDRLAVGIDYDADYGDSYANPMSKSFDVNASTYNEGDWFGVAFFDGTSYSALYAVTSYTDGTIGSALTPTVQMGSLDATSPANNRSLLGSDGGPTDADGYHMAGAYASVPEPSVAILGLGMLLKRRRA
jgi:hypothetical protein